MCFDPVENLPRREEGESLLGLRFILGRAGSGKTHTCLEEMTDHLKAVQGPARLILLVPEQATFLAERALLERMGAVMHGEVMSFRRLARRVLAQLGGALRPELSDIGRQMALASILNDRSDELQLFGALKGTPGFIRQLGATMIELARHGVTPQELCAEQEKRLLQDDILSRKLADLKLIYQAYQEYLARRFTDPEDVLTLASERLKGTSYLEGARIWVDGFSGFSPQEYELLGVLMSRAEQMNVALCLEPEELGRPLDAADLFFPTRSTYHELSELARERQVRQVPPLILPHTPRFQGALALGAIEASLFGSSTRKAPVDIDETCKIVAATDRRSEVEAAGRTLIALARDKGYRWRDMAVILRQTGPYADLVPAIFDRLRIPYFLDKKRSLTHHPLVELTRALLELVGGQWTYETVFRVLKTDFFALTRTEVDELENYCLAYGIRGERWFDGVPWRYLSRFYLDKEEEPREEDISYLNRINRLRQTAVDQLYPFYAMMRRDKQSVTQVASALHRLFDELDVEGRLTQWSQETSAGGDVDMATEHEGVLAAVMDLLQQMVEALGERDVSWSELERVMQAGLEALTLGMVPPALDQVVVGSIERSRHPALRAALILGMNEGVFPLRHEEDPLLSDGEREDLAASGLVLGPTARREQFGEAYLAYIACTRADRFLYLSYPLADEGGKPLFPSPYLMRLGRLFPSLVAEEARPHAKSTHEALSHLSGAADAIAFLAAGLGSGDVNLPSGPVWKHTYNWLLARPDGRRRLAAVFSGLEHDHVSSTLSAGVVDQLWGNPVAASVSRMERFAACPLWHYLSYGLSLKERKVQSVAAPEIGSFMHACLNRFAHYLQEHGWSWQEVEDGQAREIMTDVVQEIIPRLEGEALLRGEQQRFLARVLEKSLVEVVQVIAAQARQGRFEMVASEVDFGHGKRLPPLRVPLGDDHHLELRGQIDRVDVAPGDEGFYVRVVDYKRSGRDLDLTELYYGLSLQLAVYLSVMEEHGHHLLGRPLRPAGLFYQSLYRPLASKEGPPSLEEAERLMRRAYRLRGLMLSDQEALMLSDEGLARAGHESDVVPVKLNQDKTLARHAKVVDEQHMKLLLGYARHSLGQLGRRLVEGDIRAYPYKRKTQRACQWCEYTAACDFDVLLAGHRYRQVTQTDAEQVWNRMAHDVAVRETDGDDEVE